MRWPPMSACPPHKTPSRPAPPPSRPGRGFCAAGTATRTPRPRTSCHHRSYPGGVRADSFPLRLRCPLPLRVWTSPKTVRTHYRPRYPVSPLAVRVPRWAYGSLPPLSHGGATLSRPEVRASRAPATCASPRPAHPGPSFGNARKLAGLRCDPVMRRPPIFVWPLAGQANSSPPQSACPSRSQKPAPPRPSTLCPHRPHTTRPRAAIPVEPLRRLIGLRCGRLATLAATLPSAHRRLSWAATHIQSRASRPCHSALLRSRPARGSPGCHASGPTGFE
jgi:hypothetical protein